MYPKPKNEGIIMKIRIEKDWPYQAEGSLIKQQFTAGVTYEVDAQTAIDAVVDGVTKDPAAVELAKAAGKKTKSTSVSMMNKADLLDRIKELETGADTKLQSELKAATERLTSAEEKVTDLEKTRDEAARVSEGAADQIKDLTAENKQLQEDIVSAGKSVAKLDEAAVSAAATLETKDKEIAALKAELKSANAKAEGK